MNRLLCFLLPVVFFTIQPVCGQDFYGGLRAAWLQKADANKPVLNETLHLPISIVKMVPDQTAFQGWKSEVVSSTAPLYSSSFKAHSGIILDFGEHLTGSVSFRLDTLTGTPDAPVRLKFTFGEVPAEIATAFDPYPGELSRAWLQDEQVTVMQVPATVTISRRLAFRYVRIEVLGDSKYFDYRLSSLECKAVSAVKEFPSPLAAGADRRISAIDQVGLKTLKECMQTVYEDGPKRDRRLWIGDLYLESLANTYSFKKFDLTKRCLYLLAGLSAKDGYLTATVFETPEPHPQTGLRIMDYAFLYNVALREYLAATNDSQTANDLWPVALRQLDIIRSYLQPDGMMNFTRADKEWWLFFDWKEGLDKQAALQGISVYALKQTYELARSLHRLNEVKDVPALITKMTGAARRNLLNASSGLVESGPKKQLSYASQIWMVLAGVLSPREGQLALTRISHTPEAVYPGAPYLFHYYIQALINTGLKKAAKAELLDYWGGMVSKGADTFWEVYDAKNDFLSPYKFFPVNSYCHAWSCTPVYFIRKYPEIFQN